MKLIPMIDYVIEQWDREIYTDDFAQLMIKYATFLKQPLTLGMFIPCDENGNVLEEKKPFQDDYHKYQQAKERVIFEDCIAQKQGGEILVIHEDKPIWVDWNDKKTIEDLIPYNLTLIKNI